MLNNLGDDVRKIFLAGVGAIATTAEKSKDLLEELVKKGELTVEDGKVLNEELRHTVKDRLNDGIEDVEKLGDRLAQYSKEDLEKLKSRINELQKDEENGKQKPAK